MARLRRPINGEYSQKLKAIRSFVTFDYDLRKPLHPNSKRKIDRYFNAINDLQARPNKVFRSTSKKRVREVQKFGRNGFEGLPDIKVAFYESSPANPVALRFDDKGKLHAHGKYFDIRYVPFDVPRLVRDPNSEIQRALNDPGTRGADWFRVAVGKDGQYSIASPRKRSNVKRFVLDLMHKYGEKYTEDGRPKNNYFANWLHGLLPMTMKNQKQVDEFLRGDAKAREQLRRERKRQARKRQRNAK